MTTDRSSQGGWGQQHRSIAGTLAREAAASLGFPPEAQSHLAAALSELVTTASGGARGVDVRVMVVADTLRMQVQALGPEVVRGGWERAIPRLNAGNGRERPAFVIRVEEAEGGAVRAVLEVGLPAAAGPVPFPELALRIAPDGLPDRNTAVAEDGALAAALAEIERMRQALAGAQQTVENLSQELTETNHGMLALYSELDVQSEQLRRTSELKSRFLRHVTHELRTPVGSTLRLCQLLLDRIDGDLTPEQEHQVNLIRRSSETLADLVNDLLDLAKIEAGKTEIHPTWVDIGEVIVNLRGMLRPLVPTEVALVFESTAGLPALYTDEGKLSQILRNFISNALKFTEVGEVRVSVRALAEGRVRFSVSDTGIGIAPEDQERIFEEFGQVSGPVQQRLKGTGLGLPLSRSLAEILGGVITLESQVGRGSTFTLTLPVILPGTLPEPPERPSIKPPDAVPLKKALIIDDDEAARYVLRRVLEPCCEMVIEAGNGKDGLRRARMEPVKVILLDLSMPDMDGFEVLRRLKAEEATRAIPVIVVTSRNLEAEELRALEAEAAAVVSKFDPPREVADHLKRAFERAGLTFEPLGEVR